MGLSQVQLVVATPAASEQPNGSCCSFRNHEAFFASAPTPLIPKPRAKLKITLGKNRAQNLKISELFHRDRSS